MNNAKARLSVGVWLLLVALVCQSKAQTHSDLDSQYSITAYDVPPGTSAGTADGTMIFLRKNELVKLDLSENRLVSIPIETIEIRSWTYGNGSVWILGKSKGVSGVHRLDAQTGKVISRIPLAYRRREAISYGFGSLWKFSVSLFSSPEPVFRIDPESKEVSRIDTGGLFNGQLEISEGKVWLLGLIDGTVKCFDPLSSKVVDEFSVGAKHDNSLVKQQFRGGTYSYAIGEGTVWVRESLGSKGDRFVLSGFDVKTHERVTKLESDAALWGPVIWKGSVWISTRGDSQRGHYIAKIDPKLGHTVGRILIPVRPGDNQESVFLPPMLFADDNSLWALSSNPWSHKSPLIVRRIQLKSEEEGRSGSQ